VAYDLISSDESDDVEGGRCQIEKFSNSQVLSNSFENEILKVRVHDDLDSVADTSLNDRTWHSLLLGAGVSSPSTLLVAYLFG
jgi:hypothetical protein